jgi:DNA polymerase-3 subunit beta
MTKQIKIHQTHLNKALQICSKALDTNNILPINSMFLFDISPGKLSISACNMSMSITTDCEVESDISGRICIPGTKLASYVAKCNHELLGFEISETKEPYTHAEGKEQFKIVQSLTIKSKSGKCTLPLEPGEDFPEINNISRAELTIPAAEFLSVLTKTMFAISDDQLRPAFTGMYVHSGNDGKINYTTTNTNVLSTYCYQSDGLPELKIIIPKKSLQTIQSLNPVGELNIRIGEAIEIDFNGISTRSRLIDERYADYKSVIPTDNEINFLTSRGQLLVSLKRVTPFCDQSKRLKLDISATSVTLIAQNIDFAEEASETIDGVLTGDAIIFGCNSEYLINILNSFTQDNINFSLKSDNRAVIITEGLPTRDLENIVLLMPVAIW